MSNPGTYRQYLGLDDDLLLAGLGPDKSRKLKELGEQSDGPFDHLGKLFFKAQRKIERRHFSQRKSMMYFEKERKKMQRQMGQDPYLDSPS
jgi:preprotein translocase subunit SecA